MRFIDGKGRLFGLANLIDLFVIIAISALIVSVAVNGTMKAGSKKRASAEVYLKVLYKNIPNEIVNNKKLLKGGDVVLAGNALIEKVLYTRPAADVGGLKADYSDLAVLMKANCVILDGEYYCANVPVKINGLCTISNALYAFRDGVILDVEKIN